MCNAEQIPGIRPGNSEDPGALSFFPFPAQSGRSVPHNLQSQYNRTPWQSLYFLQAHHTGTPHSCKLSHETQHY